MIEPITVRVVSAPPSSSSRHSLMISPSVQSRPSTSVVAQSEMRSPCGSARRWAMSSMVTAAKSIIASTMAGLCSCGVPSGRFWPDSNMVTSDQ